MTGRRIYIEYVTKEHIKKKREKNLAVKTERIIGDRYYLCERKGQTDPVE